MIEIGLDFGFELSVDLVIPHKSLNGVNILSKYKGKGTEILSCFPWTD